MKYLIIFLLAALSFAAFNPSTQVPVGTVISFAGPVCPSGYISADGSSYLRTTFPVLFAAIGGVSSPWGLPDGTHFKVPPLNDRYLRGAGTAVDGNGGDTVSVGSYQGDIFTSHSHGAPVPTYAIVSGAGPYPDGLAWHGGTFGYYSTQSTGGTETRPKSYGVNFCIKF